MIVSGIISGCGTVAHRNEIAQTDADNQKTIQARIAETRAADTAKSAPVREINGVWVGARTVKVARDAELPPVFHQPIAYQFADSQSLNTFADRLSKILKINVRVTPDALIPSEQFSSKRFKSSDKAQQPPMVGPIGQIAPSMGNMGSASVGARTSYLIDRMNPFNGTPVDLLNLYTAREGNGWDYRDGEIVISKFVTRTYQIASLLDTNDMSASINKTSSVGTASSSQAGGNSGSTSSAADVSSKISAKFDVVKGLESALSGVVTPDVGKVSISTSGVVTVTDTREVQDQVKEIIDAENKNVGKQVRLRLQIVQVDLNRLDDLGVDWSWLINNTARKWNVDFNAPSGLPAGSSGFGQIGIIHNGDNSTTELFIKSLSELGRVTVNKDEAYPTINNRMLSVSTTDNFVYPAKTTAAATTSGETSAVPGVEPGMLTTGTFINMRASIQPNGSVITQFSLDASIRGKTETFDQNGIKIVYPSHSGNQYQIYSTAVSGDTAVLASIENVERRSTDRSLDGSLSPLLGGGISASTNRRLVLILMTPTIIEGVS
ncbi:hypothetical protein BUE93_22135 [Chromobacterium amazonense]|uniref:Type IVB pilus formation outer membrane protein, R64 PilN family n=1 Tax=Chromobacterium amazonense TaxID=1382803 RepID=A0A2S9WYF1_9NEIS|nr:hypothetical protein BUE93_22135 [Chromobacterium amazonense]